MTVAGVFIVQANTPSPRKVAHLLRLQSLFGGSGRNPTQEEEVESECSPPKKDGHCNWNRWKQKQIGTDSAPAPGPHSERFRSEDTGLRPTLRPRPQVGVRAEGRRPLGGRAPVRPGGAWRRLERRLAG